MLIQDALPLLAAVGAATAAIGVFALFFAIYKREPGSFGRVLLVLLSMFLTISFVFFVYMGVQSLHLQVEYEETTTEIYLNPDAGEL